MMRFPDFSEIRRWVLEIVQPLARGTFDSIDDVRAKLKDVEPFGTADHYQHSSPYGLSSAPIRGVRGYFLNLMGSALAPVIVAHLDKDRPKPAPGETIVYCLSSDGKQVPVKLSLKPDGVLRIDATSKVEVYCDDAKIVAPSKVDITSSEVAISGKLSVGGEIAGGAKISAAADVESGGDVKATGSVEAGGDLKGVNVQAMAGVTAAGAVAGASVMAGGVSLAAMQADFDSHRHTAPSGGGPTSPPI